MLTEDEHLLTTGREEDLDEFMDMDTCMVIDWRSPEDAVIEDALNFLPEGILSFTMTYQDNDTEIRVRYHSREEQINLPDQPVNCFRVVIWLRDLLQPDYDIKLFRCTRMSDTNLMLLRTTAWWRYFQTNFPDIYHDTFDDVSELNEMWELDAKDLRLKSKKKPRWKFW